MLATAASLSAAIASRTWDRGAVSSSVAAPSSAWDSTVNSPRRLMSWLRAPSSGLGPGQPVGEIVQGVGVQEQEGVLAEECLAAGASQFAEEVGTFGQRAGQAVGRGLGCLGAGAVDDGDDQVHVLREGGGEGVVVAAELDLAGDHVPGVGVDREVPRRVGRGQAGQDDGEQDHQPSLPADQADPAGQRRGGTSGELFDHDLTNPSVPKSERALVAGRPLRIFEASALRASPKTVLTQLRWHGAAV